MKKEELAVEYFKQGYNCAQAVFATYAEELGLPKETALKIASSFGGGMGKLREVCGAVSGMFMVAGLKYGYKDADLTQEEKGKHYKLIQELGLEFKKEFGSIRCCELLGINFDGSVNPQLRTKEYYQKRPCEECIREAVKIFEKASDKFNTDKV